MAARRIEPDGWPPDLEIGVLDHLLGQRGMAHDLQHEAATRPLLTFEQDGEVNAVANKLPVTQQDWWDKRRATDTVLEDIGAGDQPRLLVLNKADAVDPARMEDLRHHIYSPDVQPDLTHHHGAPDGTHHALYGQKVKSTLKSLLAVMR